MGAIPYIEGVGGPNSENGSSFVEISNTKRCAESHVTRGRYGVGGVCDVTKCYGSP